MSVNLIVSITHVIDVRVTSTTMMTRFSFIAPRCEVTPNNPGKPFGKHGTRNYNKSLHKIEAALQRELGTFKSNRKTAVKGKNWNSCDQTSLWIHSINKYSLNIFSLYKEHTHGKWHICSTAITLITFHKAFLQRRFFYHSHCPPVWTKYRKQRIAHAVPTKAALH